MLCSRFLWINLIQVFLVIQSLIGWLLQGFSNVMIFKIVKKTKQLRSLLRGVVQGFEWLEKLGFIRKIMLWSKVPGVLCKAWYRLFICMFLSWYLHPIKCSCCGLWLHILQEILLVARGVRPFSTLQVYVNGVEA